MESVYLDNASTTPLREEVVKRIADSLKLNFGNPSSTHQFGRTSKLVIEACRKTISEALNANKAEIFFTSGGTESINLILQSAVLHLGVTHIVTTKIEHHAVLNTVEFLEKHYGVKLSYVAIDSVGRPILSNLDLLLKQKGKTLVSLMHINNEIGTITDLQEVSSICLANNALFHTDAVQSFGHYKIDVKALHIDFLSASAHKLHGPKGIGFAFVKQNTGLKPLIHGGEQERGLRSGTESVHNIAGLETATKLAYHNLEAENEKISDLKSYFVNKLKAAFPDLIIHGGSNYKSTSYKILNVGFPSLVHKSATLLFQLDLKGIACSKGSACQSGSQKGSHVLAELLDNEDYKIPALRFSFSYLNTKRELDYVVAVLKDL